MCVEIYIVNVCIYIYSKCIYIYIFLYICIHTCSWVIKYILYMYSVLSTYNSQLHTYNKSLRIYRRYRRVFSFRFKLYIPSLKFHWDVWIWNWLLCRIQFSCPELLQGGGVSRSSARLQPRTVYFLPDGKLTLFGPISLLSCSLAHPSFHSVFLSLLVSSSAFQSSGCVVLMFCVWVCGVCVYVCVRERERELRKGQCRGNGVISTIQINNCHTLWLVYCLSTV